MSEAWLAPATLAELLAALAGGAALPAGGATDLLPRHKQGLLPVSRLACTRVPELRRLRIADEGIELGAALTLRELIEHEELRVRYPAIARCLALVGAPQHRHAGTLGGNLCLDTRCQWYNQSARWRLAVDGCLKCGGADCHVQPGGTRCHAALSSDGAPLFIALGARARLLTARGERELPLEALYRREGREHLELAPGELLAQVLLEPPRGARATYHKLRLRESFDYPLLGAAGCLRAEDGRVRSLRLCFGAAAPWPVLLDEVALGAAGSPPAELDRDALVECCRAACGQPSGALPHPAWRRAMVPVLAARVLKDLGI